jgi:ABC-type amino acid transport substrate-binding protein
MADVFISYAKSRHDLTESLAKDLEAAGLSVWWDTSLQAGANFRSEIDDQLNDCKAAIIVWTPESIKSEWVIAEADHAWQQRKLINTHVPEVRPHQIPKPFNQLHSVEITNRAQIISVVKNRAQRASQVEDTAGTPPHELDLQKGRAGRGGRFGILKSTYALLAIAASVIVASLMGLALLGFIPIFSPKLPTAVPEWTMSGTTFIGQPIHLGWNYDVQSAAEGSRPAASVLFQISSSGRPDFDRDVRTDSYADGQHKYISHINATRFWRVRAVDYRTKKPLSDWSATIRLTQYDSAFDRIKATGKVLVGMSNTEIQGVFKWVDDKGFRGFDVTLARLIVQRLSHNVGHPLEMLIVSVPWTHILDMPVQGRSDIIISSITKLKQREPQHLITFSSTYYCTAAALIYRVGTEGRTIRDMIAGKIVGVQKKTTSARHAAAIAKEMHIKIEYFDTTEALIDKLLKTNIDFGIVDAPFAAAAQYSNRVNGRDRLKFKEFRKADFPASMPEDEQVEAYALAVRSGEFELLGAIDKIIAEAKQSGLLTRLLKEATREYEDASGIPRGGQGGIALRERPWECSR